MPERIIAIVEDGVLRPTVPLALPEGTRVAVTISDLAALPESKQRSIDDVKKTVAAIAAMPMEPGPEFSGRDHDRILYGESGAR